MTCLDGLEAALEGKTFLLGDAFTAADIMMGYSLRLAQRMQVLALDHPRESEYFARLEARPGYQKSLV